MKNVLITGGAGGIGSEIVSEFVRRGYCAHVIDIDPKNMQILAETHKDSVALHAVDVTDTEAVSALADTLRGKVAFDHIITLAGRAIPEEWEGFLNAPATAIHRSIGLNLIGHLQVIHAFVPLMSTELARSVLLISSINAICDFGLPIYSAAKAGLTGFVNSSLGEFGKRGIRINSILPGTVVSEATLKEPKDFSALLKTTALDRFATAREVAATAGFICCELPGMTGQNIVLDAGQSKKH